MFSATKVMGKYLILWILQFVFFGSLVIQGGFMMDGDSAPIFIASIILLVLSVFLIVRLIRINGKMYWLFFALFVVIASAIGGFVGINSDEEYNTLGYFLIFFGSFGILGSLLMPTTMLFGRKR